MITKEHALNLLGNRTADLTPLERGLLEDILKLKKKNAKLKRSLARAREAD